MSALHAKLYRNLQKAVLTGFWGPFKKQISKKLKKKHQKNIFKNG